MEHQLTPGEAMYGLCAWLTARPIRTVMSGHDNEVPIIRLVEKFAVANKIPPPDGDWFDKFNIPDDDPNNMTLDELAYNKSCLPGIIVNDDNETQEVIIADTVSPGDQYENDMPKILSLRRITKEGREIGMDYVQSDIALEQTTDLAKFLHENFKDEVTKDDHGDKSPIEMVKYLLSDYKKSIDSNQSNK